MERVSIGPLVRYCVPPFVTHFEEKKLRNLSNFWKVLKIYWHNKWKEYQLNPWWDTAYLPSGDKTFSRTKKAHRSSMIFKVWYTFPNQKINIVIKTQVKTIEPLLDMLRISLRGIIRFWWPGNPSLHNMTTLLEHNIIKIDRHPIRVPLSQCSSWIRESQDFMKFNFRSMKKI